MSVDLPSVVPFLAGGREDRALLGGKGANLAELTRLGIPVPPGFVITTEVCATYQESGELAHGLLAEVLDAIGGLEEQLDRRFGDPLAPLLLSVRSGAPTSMPGMMETVLNVGLAESTFDGFAAWVGSVAIAEDCRQRLALSFAAAAGTALPELPSEQLEQAIAAVFASWSSDRAKLYRRYHRIADRGTAVVVQAMVFGNAGPRSGTGVAFTRDPSTGERRLFGEYLAGGQGEDVVAGTHNVGDLDELRDEEPEIHAQLQQLGELFERHFGDMCEIELTLERGKLWILQTRRAQRSALAAIRVAVALVQERVIDRSEALSRVSADTLSALRAPTLDLERLEEASVLSTATGSSPGLVTGVVALSSREAVKRAAAGERVVLVCRDTSPEDLDGMIACAGLLTARGGKTSHAAVVARGLGRTCVCGAEEVVIDADAGVLRVGAAVVREGELLSLDGDGGRVILGEAPATDPALPVEAGILECWLAEAAVEG
jgi:pyruvate, orthophosphate dikinase